jgi:hypothetical protein
MHCGALFDHAKFLPAGETRGVDGIDGALTPEFLHDDPDDGPAHGAEDQNRGVGLGDHGISQAQQDSDHQTYNPSRPRQANRSNDKPDGEAIDESARQRGAFVGKLLRNHRRGGKGAVNQPADEAQGETRHRSSLLARRERSRVRIRLSKIVCSTGLEGLDFALQVLPPLRFRKSFDGVAQHGPRHTRMMRLEEFLQRSQILFADFAQHPAGGLVDQFFLRRPAVSRPV